VRATRVAKNVQQALLLAGSGHKADALGPGDLLDHTPDQAIRGGTREGAIDLQAGVL